MENQILLVKLQHMNRDPSVTIGHDTGENIKEFSFPEHDLAAVTSARGSTEEISELPPTGSEVSTSCLYIHTLLTATHFIDALKLPSCCQGILFKVNT